ncbi:hypothetical protein TM7x_00060 [Candidatus Nanosynbacter lyticus]|uniref:Uncharacterized protein n=1 Tax=Candidatus Nanosynbacter lyticus TaxID=2093824 RepID=A0A6S4GQN5_9BACT|nr:hypothetical protein [Candidatus Nanosynbacter lyticus]AJA06679.1 hypothetical protein TM7x_00060 [Candidatus Nanosynbacter lyticus]QCT41191.1 hypothetical protein FBF38_00060 [TM7 phylum sp. oral taxon 952]
MRYFYYNPIKPLLIILFASLAFIILQPILVAYADDATSKPIKGGAVICNTEYGNYKKTPQGEESKDDGWWWCYSSKSNHRVSYDRLKCDSGYKAESREVQGSTPKEGPYSQGRCVELSKEEQVKNARKKASIDAATNQVTMPKLEEALKPTITNSTWYKELPDSEKIEAGCATIGDSISCDQNAKSKLAKKLIGTCIAAAEESVSSRKYGDTGSSAKDQYFTDCVSSRSGIDKSQVIQNMTTIAWDDIKKEMDAKAQEAENALNKPEESDEEKNSCGVDGVGWLVCPLMSFAGSLGDASYSAISQFLSIDPGIFKNDSTSGGLKQAWDFFRDIANATFALIFLWVIFSQISNVGISNYGIKRILPRLIIGALLVNLSFYLCQLAVDLSNILGFSLKGVLEGAASGIDTQSAATGSFYNLIAAGLTLVGVGLFIFLAVSIPTILALLLALLVVLVILIVRQSAIILLIAISPLAFAAWLLPNTENLFKKWVSVFRGLLIVFPVISLLYGAGKLAGAVLAASATDDPNNPKETMQFAALAASILPLGATPFVLQSSLNSLGNIGAKIGRMGANAHSRFAGNVKGTAKGRVDNSVIGDTKRKYSDFMDRKRASRRTGKIATWRDSSPLGRFMGWDKGGARARATVAKAFESDVENASTMLQGMTSGNIANIANGTNTTASKAMRAAAIDHIMANGSFEERMKVLSSLKGVDTSIKQRAIKGSFAKGDNNIIGNGFGDAILNDKIDGMQNLSNMAVNNTESGNLQAEHLVQNGAATKWLSKAIADSKNEKASAAFKKAGEVAVSNPNTAKNINQAIYEALSAHGVVAENTPQNTSSSNSQQNNQQSNSSSGGIIIPSDEEVNKYGR